MTLTPTLLKEAVEKDLAKQLVGARVLLDRFKVIDEASRKTSAYTDPYYAPFYYHIGKYISPKSMIEIGFRLGLLSGSFFTSCKTVNRFVAFQQRLENVFYSPTFGKHNIRKVYRQKFNWHVGEIFDKELEDTLIGKWDLAIINEETTYEKHRTYLEFIWEKMGLNGIIVVEYANFHDSCKNAFMDFCKIVSREPVICKTKYGVGIIQR
jgi:hypothetical protein